MGVRYLDTSALVKLYVSEPGTEAMLDLASRARGHRLVLLALARVELVAALRGRQRRGDVGPEQVDQLDARFAQHVASRYVVQSLTDVVLDAAVSLAQRHPLRAYDAVQLAGALVASRTLGDEDGPLVLACSDGRLNEAATREGLAVFDPTVAAPG